jgi:hypothetical protein
MKFMVPMDEDELRQRILALRPDIAAEARELANVLREIVKTEREKRERIDCKITLHAREKTEPSQPDLIGSGPIGGRFYQVAAWIRAQKLELRFSSHEQRRRPV